MQTYYIVIRSFNKFLKLFKTFSLRYYPFKNSIIIHKKKTMKIITMTNIFISDKSYPNLHAILSSLTVVTVQLLQLRPLE